MGVTDSKTTFYQLNLYMNYHKIIHHKLRWLFGNAGLPSDTALRPIPKKRAQAHTYL